MAEFVSQCAETSSHRQSCLQSHHPISSLIPSSPSLPENDAKPDVSCGEAVDTPLLQPSNNYINDDAMDSDTY